MERATTPPQQSGDANAFAPRHVLIAEDSSVTQDLLKLLLTQRGHKVDIVGDGERAAEKLRERHYDVALLDFRLPKQSGLKVAKDFLASRGAGEARPRLVAITADVEGLLADADNCEAFDEIVPKPLDIYAVSKLVEGETVESPEAPSGPTTEAAPSPQKSAKPSPLEALGYSFLRWPEDFDAKRLAAQNLAARVSEARLDAILVSKAADAPALAMIWRQNPLHLLPVVDMTGRLGSQADLNGSSLSFGRAEEVAQLVRDFHERRADIHSDFFRAEDMGDKLLARIAAAGGRLKAEYAPSEKEFVRHSAPLEEASLIREAEKLRAAGYLRAVFFDRLHQCGSCGSSRLNVREECAKCGSPHLHEEPYLHHFKCAYQGPEKDFRQGDQLVCPKCRKALTHFSVDYDKPGFLVSCEACGHTASEAKVGFVCMDCGAHSSGETAPTRDIYSYEITERGRAYLDVGRAYLGETARSLRFADLPLDLVVKLNAAARRYNEEKAPFTLINIGYQNARAIERDQGTRQFAQTRDLFLENLRNALPDAHFVKGSTYDFALIAGAERSRFEERLDDLKTTAMRTVRLDPGAVLQAFGPEDFA